MKVRTIPWIAGAAAILAISQVQAVTLTWNELLDEDYGATVAAHVFADTLEEVSGGKMLIDLYTNGALGTEAESMQGLQCGVLDIFRGNASSLPDYGAELIGATGLPYVFSDMDQLKAVAESDFGQELLDSVEEADCGFIALDWLVEGPRSLFLTENAYQKLGRPKDFSLEMMAGLNIRIPNTDLLRTTMQALGATATPITYSELYDSLQAGNIDGAENGVTPYISLHFYEVAPYFVTDAHTFGCGVILVSQSTWNRLTEEEKGWMREAGEAARDACYAYNSRQEQACFDRFDELGITRLSVTDIDAWHDVCSDVYQEQSKAVQDVVRRIRERDY